VIILVRSVTVALGCGFSLFLWCLPAAAIAPAVYQFGIPSQPLSQSLIQFSHQSGLAIVFPDPVARGLTNPAVTGEMSVDSALLQLLADTELAYKLIDNRIIAVYDSRCRNDHSCLEEEALLLQYPLYVPGIEELYVYGSPVTGSRIKRSHLRGSAPVDILSSPDIELSGAQTIGEILRYVPAVSGNSTSTAISNGGDGTATVTLRGLPASSTLVLINGRRVANDGLAGESIDLNSIAPAAVERIEILKDGASAIYGSDAIAGVINIIMKEDFYGLLVEQFYGSSGDQDGESKTTTLQYGTGFKHGSLFFSASHFDQQEIASRDRKVSRSADGRFQGGADLRSSATPNARITLPGGETVIFDEAEGDYRAAGENDLFDFPQFTSSLVPSQRNFFYTNISYDITEQLTASVEASYTDTSAKAKLAPTPVFTAFELSPITVAADNIYNPFSTDIVDLRRRMLELPTRRQQNNSDVSRLSAVLEGLHRGWSWELAYSYSRSKAKESLTSLIDADNLRRGVGPAGGCQGATIDGCVPVNLFGPPGSIDAQQLAFLQVAGKVKGESELETWSLNATRTLLELPQGNIDFAFGMEYRDESTKKNPSALIADVGTIGGNNFEATRGDRKVREIYAESIIPLWQSADDAQKLDLEIALRWSSYSDFGTTRNPKFGFRFQMSPNWLLRATYAEGFRAPTLNELFQGASENQAFISDPCTLPQNVGVLSGCQQQADPSRNQFLTVTGGNESLDEETAKSWGLGLVWTPDYVPGLSASLDYFDIDTENVIDSSAQFIVNQNAANDLFPDRVTRDAAGNLQLVTATNLNVGERRVKGLDIRFDYLLPNRAWGQWSSAVNFTYIDEYSIQLDRESETVELAGTFIDPASEGLGGIPEWKGNIGIQWARQRWRGSYDIHYVSDLREDVPSSTRRRDIDSWLVHDVQFSYVFNLFKGLRLSMGVDNVLDEEAPFAASAFNDNIDARTHDLKGRFWYAKLSQRM
jgi:iron complex outermembrane receptor protein